MKRILLIIAIILYSAACMFSQKLIKNSLEKGRFALQFQVGQDFFLRPFQGSVLSGKYNIFNRSSVRFGVSLENNFETDHKINNTDTTKQQYVSIILNVQFVRYLKDAEDVSLYLGGGTFYSRTFSKVTQGRRYNGWSLGASGIIGVEWFFNHNMSLSCEYGILIFYSEIITGDYAGANNTLSRGINISSDDQFKFGFTLYL